MTYSRKRYWLALGSALAIAAAFLVLNPRMDIGPVGHGMFKMAVVAVCGALAFLAYFSLDEIQRQNEMRAWYYGGPLALLFGVVPVVLLMSNTGLEAMAVFFHNTSPIAPDMLYSPRGYFCMGIAVTVVAQAIGHYIARAIFTVVERAR
jgi:uncharacterized membrane protein